MPLSTLFAPDERIPDLDEDDFGELLELVAEEALRRGRGRDLLRLRLEGDFLADDGEGDRVLVEDRVILVAKVFTAKARNLAGCGFDPADQAVIDAVSTIVVDTALLLEGSVPLNDWVAAARTEGWL